MLPSHAARAGPWLALLLLCAPLSGAADPGETPVAADGVVVRVDRSRSTVLVDHGAIEGMLPSGRTEFPADDVGLLDGLRAGDRVRFAVSPGPAGHGVLTVTELRLEPPGQVDRLGLLPSAGLIGGALLAAALVVQSIRILRQLRRIRERDRALLEQQRELRSSLTAGLSELTQGLRDVADRLRSDMARVQGAAEAPPVAATLPADRGDGLPLVVVERGATETYRLLKSRLATSRARVIWDRRRGDRRTGAAPAPTDRRRRERRRPPSVTWSALGYVVAERAERHLTVVA